MKVKKKCSHGHTYYKSTHSLQSESRALQFQISDNFNLSSFSGTSISYKRHVSEDRARRFGLHLNNRYSMMDFPDRDDEMENSILDLNFGIGYSWMINLSYYIFIL